MFQDEGRHGDAEPLLRDAIAIRAGSFGTTSWRTAEVELTLGQSLAALGRLDEAEPLFAGGHERLRADSTAPPRALQRADSLLAGHYDRTGRAELASQLRARAAAGNRSS